jgi:hypothetical protein
MRHKITTTLAVLCGLAGLYFGFGFLLNPHAADAFGIQPWPTGNAAGYFVVKAVRDIAYGLIVFVLLARGHRRTLGWVVLIDALIPLGDGTAVATHGGGWLTALEIHYSAAAVVLIAALMLLTEKPQPAAEKPAAEKPAAERLAAETAAAGKPGAGKPAVGEPAEKPRQVHESPA